jgi:hypothetical protein
MLRGRDRQRVAVDALLRRARVGRGGVLVVCGEPGSGRTALLHHARRSYEAVLCVDDAHVLDDDLRQLAADVDGTEAALLIATEGDTFGLPAVVLDPLDRAESLLVLHDLLPGLPAALAVDLADMACGNPLALVELAGSLTSDQLGGIAPPPDGLPPTSSLRGRLLARFAALSQQARDVVALAAVDEELTADALARLTGDLPAVTEAGALLDPRRLIRSTLSAGLSPAVRFQAHARLAELLPPGPRRTWHAACSSHSGPAAAAPVRRCGDGAVAGSAGTDPADRLTSGVGSACRRGDGAVAGSAGTEPADQLTSGAEHARRCGDGAVAASTATDPADLLTSSAEHARRCGDFATAARDHDRAAQLAACSTRPPTTGRTAHRTARGRFCARRCG